MKSNNLPCCIVEDLLPNYIEHLTSEASNKEIEAHLRTCEKCNKKFLEQYEPVPSPGDDQAAIQFLSKVKRRSKQKIIFSAIITLLLCIILFYVFVLHQFAFHFSVQNVYRLSDGGIYFELCATGKESKIHLISYSDDFSEEQSSYFIHMGYSLFSLWQPDTRSEGSSKCYSFCISPEYANQIAGKGALVYQQGPQQLTIWDGKTPLPSAPLAIEEKASEVISPFVVSYR